MTAPSIAEAGSGTVPTWVIRHAHRSVWLYALLDALDVDKEGAEICLSDLMDYSGAAKRTVQDTLRRLEAIGAVQTQMRRHPDGTWAPNRFVLIREEPSVTSARSNGHAA
ncbi:hypothetical protein ACFWGI_36735 [Streptomyces niveus]|uniref:hypothetical protein n=1 Tax=Streptomyces niveus TaxID=193462 RepID=UPI003650CDB4